MPKGTSDLVLRWLLLLQAAHRYTCVVGRKKDKGKRGRKSPPEMYHLYLIGQIVSYNHLEPLDYKRMCLAIVFSWENSSSLQKDGKKIDTG